MATSCRGPPLHRYLQRVDAALFAFRGHRASVAAAVLVSSAGQIALAGTFMIAGTVVIPDVPGWTTAFLSLLGMVANAVPVTPGGIGVGEAAFEALFALAGYDGGARLMLVWRAGLLPLALLGGLLYALHGQGRATDADERALANNLAHD